MNKTMKANATDHKTKTKKTNKNLCQFRRPRGKRHNTCRVCDVGGYLVECHTCLVACHTKCGNNMQINVQEREVIWRCDEFITGDGPTNCSFAVYETKTQGTRQQKVRKQITKGFVTKYDDV